MKAAQLYFIVVLFLFPFSAYGNNSDSDSISVELGDTVRVKLQKSHEPMDYGGLVSHGYTPRVFYTSDSKEVVDSVKFRMIFNYVLKFLSDGRLKYKIPAYSNKSFIKSDIEFIIHKDSMINNCNQNYDNLKKWYIGEYNKASKEYSIWITSLKGIKWHVDSLKFLEKLEIEPLIGNVYRGKFNTKYGHYLFGVGENQSRESEMYGYHHPVITVEGKYENNGTLRPDIFEGRKYEKYKGIGGLVSFSPDDIYVIDSVTPDFSELILVRDNGQVPVESLPEDVVKRLDPYLSEAGKQNKLLLVDIWGTWCNPCVGSMPRLKEIEDNHKDRILGLSLCIDEESKRAHSDEILDKKGIEGLRMFVTLEDEFVKSLKPAAFPTYYILDGNAAIRLKGDGTSCLDIIEDYLRNL